MGDMFASCVTNNNGLYTQDTMATVRTVTNNSGSIDTPDSLLWIINDIANTTGSVFINFDDSVSEIEISGETHIQCDNLTISGLHTDGITQVRIKNANTQPSTLALFSMLGNPIAIKTVINLLNLEMIGDLTIDPALACKFFHISYVANVSIINCFFRDNTANNTLAKDQGGALYIQAPRDSLFVSGCTFSGNTAAVGGACFINSVSSSVIQIMSCEFVGNASTGSTGGGGLVISGDSTAAMVFDTSFTGNTSAGDGGGLYVTGSSNAVRRCTFDSNTAGRTGGGLFSASELAVIRCQFNQNTASGGGGMGCKGSSVSMELSAFNGNISTGADTSSVLSRCGGAMVSQGSTIDICSTLFANNESVNGGGIAYQGDTADSTFRICNCTLYGNTATETGGGFLCTDSVIPLVLINCTIASNTAGTGGGISNAAGVDLELGNTLVAANTAAVDFDISGVVSTLGNNLVGIADVDNGLGGTDLTGSIGSPLDPGLGLLADNGGFAFTAALLPSSPAIAAGNVALLPVGNPLFTYDQRGTMYPRTNDGRVDIGAYGLQPGIICFRAGSHVLVKEISTDDIVTIDIALVTSDAHTVYDTLTDTYVPIIYNAVGKAREFYRLALDLIDVNVPDADLDMAGPHLIVQGGLRAQASDIDGAVKIDTDPELVYSICTTTESVILVNNLSVIAWDASQWDAYVALNHISWVNNQG